jgi:hypothetical protein
MFHLDRLRAVSPRRMVITVAALAATAGGGGLMLSAQSVSADRPATRSAATPTAIPIHVMTPPAVAPQTAEPVAAQTPGDKDNERETCDRAEPAKNDRDANDRDANGLHPDERSGSDDVCTPGTSDTDHGDGADRGTGDGSDRGVGGRDS